MNSIQPSSPMSIIVLFSASLLFYIVTVLYLNYRKCPQIKGPLLASVSGLWLFWSTFASRVSLDCAAEHEKYGKLLCFVLRLEANSVEVLSYG